MTDHSHDHDHDHHSTESTRRLALVAVVNFAGFVVEFAGALAFGSVALLGDAVHMLFDSLAYVMAFAAAALAERDGGDRWSYGLHRLEPLSAFVNGALLVPMVGYILYESYTRFLSPVEIGVVPTLAIAGGGLVVNVLSVAVLEGDEMSLNERGAFYHLIGDAGGSVVVIIGLVATEYADIQWADPLAAVLIAGVVLWSAGRLIRGSGHIFLHRSPVETGELSTTVSEVSGVTSVEDVHVWQICSELTIATVHVCVDGSSSFSEAESVVSRVHRALADVGVDHATVEVASTYPPGDDHLNSHEH